VASEWRCWRIRWWQTTPWPTRPSPRGCSSTAAVPEAIHATGAGRAKDCSSWAGAVLMDDLFDGLVAPRRGAIRRRTTWTTRCGRTAWSTACRSSRTECSGTLAVQHTPPSDYHLRCKLGGDGKLGTLTYESTVLAGIHGMYILKLSVDD
jgi:hypothetical protein